MILPRIGDQRRAVVCPEVTRTQIVQFAGATGDLSPLHVDEPAAMELGYPSVMAHGMLTMAVTGSLLTEWWGDDRLTAFGARFLASVWPGDELTAVAVVTAVREARPGSCVDLQLTTTNQSGVVVLTGTATVRMLEPVGE
ncbi:MaoC family dehydratase [Frankia gtarii]|uniref:MaoC family dehydratase n=1 Tax=Frankia gtarii TaxID=2950102 RepID=UPI0021BF5DAE|nr:MaoC/PaaZ C-terminal domain-containing protein [Frankia gtarii]